MIPGPVCELRLCGSALVQALADCQQQQSDVDAVITDFMAPLRTALDAVIGVTA